MNLWRLTRFLASISLGMVAVWRWSVLPLQFEIALPGFEQATRRALKLPESEAAVLARRTLDELRRHRRVGKRDIRFAMLAAVNERIRNQLSAARDIYTQALKYHQRPELYLNLALIEHDLGDTEKATSNLARALRFAPEMSTQLEDSHFLRRAIRVLRRGLERAPYCCAADYDGDRLPDLLKRQPSHQSVLPAGITFPIASPWLPMLAWNGGAQPSLLIQNMETFEVVLLHEARRGTAGRPERLAMLSNELHVAGTCRFGRGGSPAIVVSNTETGETKRWTRSASGWAEAASPSLLETDAFVEACADFNLDGEDDAIYRNKSGQRYIILLNDLRKVSLAPLPPAGFHRELIATGDFTGDSSPDLLWYDFETGRVLIWVMRNHHVESVRDWRHESMRK